MKRTHTAAVPVFEKFVVAGFAIVLVLGSGLLSGCGQSSSAQAGPPPPMPVTVVKLQPTDVPITGEWVGTLDGYVNAQIQPQASGYLIGRTTAKAPRLQKDRCCLRLIRALSRPHWIRRRGNWNRPRDKCNKRRRNSDLAQINVNRDTPLAKARAIAQSQLDNEIQQKAQS